MILNNCYKFLYSYIALNIRQVSPQIANKSGIHDNRHVLISYKSLMKISNLDILKKIIFLSRGKIRMDKFFVLCHLSIFTGSIVRF